MKEFCDSILHLEGMKDVDLGMRITGKALTAMYESVAIPGSVQLQDMEKTGVMRLWRWSLHLFSRNQLDVYLYVKILTVGATQ